MKFNNHKCFFTLLFLDSHIFYFKYFFHYSPIRGSNHNINFIVNYFRSTPHYKFIFFESRLINIGLQNALGYFCCKFSSTLESYSSHYFLLPIPTVKLANLQYKQGCFVVQRGIYSVSLSSIRASTLIAS